MHWIFIKCCLPSAIKYDMSRNENSRILHLLNLIAIMLFHRLCQQHLHLQLFHLAWLTHSPASIVSKAYHSILPIQYTSNSFQILSSWILHQPSEFLLCKLASFFDILPPKIFHIEKIWYILFYCLANQSQSFS